MQLFVYLVLSVGTLIESHYILQQQIPLHTIQYVHPAALIPAHFYSINHGAGISTGGVSRETLEEHSGEDVQQSLLPDISDEQANLDPDDTQIPVKPSFPTLPNPNPGYLPPRSPPKIPASSGDPGIIFNGPHPDGSYDFSYNQDDQKRTEKGDSQGNVEGTYSYVGSDGKDVTITYTAGAGKGYIPKGEGLLPPPTPGVGEHGSGNGDDDDDQQPIPSGQQPIGPNDDDSQHQVPLPGPGVEEGNQKGMPYDYNYEAHASGKKEVADDNGHVKGSYWYIDGAGDNRTVTYTVNGDEGFVANELVSPGSGPHGSEGINPSRPPVKGVSGTKRPGGDIPSVPHNPNRPPTPPTKGVHPPTKGGQPPSKGTPPPCKGAIGNCGKGSSKGGSARGSGGSGWDKYPLGTSVVQH